MKKIILLLILCIAITANAQKAIKGTSKTAFKFKPTYERGIPPNLFVELNFEDDDRNSILESEKSAKIYSELPEDIKPPKKKNKKEKLLANLPLNFNRHKYLEVARSLSIADKTAEGYITNFVKNRLIHRDSQDKYINSYLQTDNYPDNFTINKTQDIKKQKLKGVRPSNEEKYQQYLKYKKFVDDIEKKYTKQIYDLLLLNKPFSMDKIIQLVENPPQVNTTVFEVFEAWIKELYK